MIAGATTDNGGNWTLVTKYVAARTNPQNTAFSEVDTYVGLDRLTNVMRGGAANQSWSLDSTGNWNSLAITTTGTVTETHTHNAANEVLTVSAQTAPIHDLAGNITQAAKPNTPAANQVYVYDGWNRLVQVKETNGTVIATYEYDGRGNRIQKTTGATVRDYFHNDGGQVVEVRVNNVLNQTFVWDLSYIDSPVMTKRDTASDGVLDQSYYFTFDALRNVTALINAANGNVLERYHYDAYGKVQIYTSTWGALSASAYANITTFTGRELDTETGLYYFRARYFDPSLGRFLARDPQDYVDGMNLYSGYFVPGGVDPWGTIVTDELDDLKRRIIELEDEKKNLPNRWPGDDDEIIKLRKATEAEIDGDIAEIQKRLRILNDSAKVADEHKRLRGDAHKDPLGAQESFDHAKSKGKVPEFYDSTKTDDLAKHHLAEQSRKGGRFVKKLKAMLPGPVGLLIGGYFFPGDAEAKGLGGATANEAFDSVPILEWIKPIMELLTGEDWFPDEGQKGAFDEGGCLGPDYWDKWHNKRNNPGKLTPWEPKQ